MRGSGQEDAAAAVSSSGLEDRRRVAEQSASPRYSRRSQEILQSAARVFTQRGYEATTLADIAEEVGTDRATLYYYFKSKADILRAAISGVHDESVANFRRIAAAPEDAITKLRMVIRSLVEVFHTSYPYSALYFQDSILKSPDFDPDWVKQLLQRERVIERIVVDVITQGQAEHTFRTDTDAALLAKLVLSVNWTYRWYRPKGGYSTDQIVEAFEGVLLKGILAEPAPGA